MAWIESHDDIWTHHKTRTLCRLLKINSVRAVGHLTSLWHFVLANAWRDADLTAWGDDGIEEAARWSGQPGAFVAAARDSGYLDGCIVHGWLDRAGELVKERFRNERRRSDRVYRGSTGDLPGIYRRLTTTTVPYRTVPTDLTTATPSAVDLSKDALKAHDTRMRAHKLAEARLPFGFGDYPKGVHLMDLPVETLKAILERLPNIGKGLALMLREIVAIKENERKQS